MVLLQQASAIHSEMLLASEPVHRRFCEKHGLRFTLHFGMGRWDTPADAKVGCILEELKGVRLDDGLLWVDADALIVKDFDPLLELGGEDLRMSFVRGHFCMGVMMLRPAAKVLNWLKDVGTDHCGIAAAKLEEHRLFPHRLGPEFNASPDDAKAVIKHWYGREKRKALTEMQVEAKRVFNAVA